VRGKKEEKLPMKGSANHHMLQPLGAVAEEQKIRPVRAPRATQQKSLKGRIMRNHSTQFWKNEL
jgi:hypothetical protein